MLCSNFGQHKPAWRLKPTFASCRLQASQSDYLMTLFHAVTEIEAAVLAAGQQSNDLHAKAESDRGSTV